uniref:Uncharacterized protein n=1 Tax=Tricholoma flavovirens TaxID=80606 RepID=A0A6C0W4A0_9AGAR|nr:hypothetical protein [Tricholoma flavovirens]QIC20259.1 hypothetical protein [Tricholoma flavovirens]
MNNTLSKQLNHFYKSRSIFNGYIIKNKYLILSLLILTLITFIFNKNIYYFKGLNFYEVNSFTIILYIVLFYSIYIKFSIMIRIISLFRSINYFYYNIRFNIIKNIKTIALYYYIFNIFFLTISILFVNNLNNNLYTLNINNYVEYTDILSVLLLLFYLKPIFKKEFKIINNNINPLLVVFNLSLILLPFILLNFYYDQIISLVDKYIIKHMTIYCDSNDNTDFNKVLKNETINSPSLKIINITNLYDIETKFLQCFIMENIKSNNKLELNDSIYNSFMRQSGIEYKIDIKILEFFNEHIGVISSNNISKNQLIEFIHRLFDLDMGYKNKLESMKSELYNQMVEMNELKHEKYKFYISAPNKYKKFCDYIYIKEEELAQNHVNQVNQLNIEQQKYISEEMNKFTKQPNKFNIILNNPLKLFKFNFNNLKPSIDENLDDYKDLFFKSNKSSTSINSVDSDKTIKQSDFKNPL